MKKKLRELQLIDVDILNAVVKILNKYHLKYYLIGGTLLGAVRHQGFIPWDDDMDIAMPRKDYDIFLNKYYKELPSHLSIKNFQNDLKYKYYISRIIDQRYWVREVRDKSSQDSLINVSIDIFPIDGTPNNEIARNIYYLRIMYYRALISLIQKNNIDFERNRNFLERLMIIIGTHIPLDKFFSTNKLQYKIDKILKQQASNSKFAGTIMGAYRTREIVPRYFFGGGANVRFEGKIYVGPQKYDEYLTHMYGNYMQLPSKKEQKQKRHFEILKSKGD
ncbi:LicD family protein [Pediococcus parvulus]|uniref:LicD family protein n=1 Tax=Pediococcus parvulus TaxID=54062 RepID=A0AAP5WDC6_9LACO|nr:LicD family protein [Pediococcus parvulus]MDV7694009.1 LicD family protein [Pediococcus parvulus]